MEGTIYTEIGSYDLHDTYYDDQVVMIEMHLDMDYEDLTFFSDFTNLKHILIYTYEYKIGSLRGVENFPKLITLTIHNNDRPIESIKGIEKCKKLSSFIIDNSSDHDLRPLKRCNKLLVFLYNKGKLNDFTGYNIDDSEFPKLGNKILINQMNNNIENLMELF